MQGNATEAPRLLRGPAAQLGEGTAQTYQEIHMDTETISAAPRMLTP